MKKKLVPFIFAVSMLTALPFTARAVDGPEEDSGNVKYGNFADIDTKAQGSTPVLTAIPECTMTIPRDTTIKRGSLAANIGRVTIDGHYFVKPYYVQVSAERNNFTVVDPVTHNAKGANALAKEDIIFDVATSAAVPNTDSSVTATSLETFVKTGEINLTNDDKSSYAHQKRAARRFWKDETLAQAQQATAYNAGEICDINGQEDIYVNIGATQWTGVGGSETKTKPVGGQYKGNITFSAEFKDDYESTMGEWTELAN